MSDKYDKTFCGYITSTMHLESNIQLYNKKANMGNIWASQYLSMQRYLKIKMEF